MEQVLVRRLQKRDASQIGRIDAAITKAPQRTDFKRLVEEVVGRENAAGFVAEAEGKVVAFMISHVTLGSFGADRCAWIAMFGVAPKYMDQGIGKKLAEEIFAFHKERGIKEIYTSVRWDSADILSFCKTLGFERSEFLHLRKSLNQSRAGPESAERKNQPGSLGAREREP
jgi:ribosomal protein S18 acetylase RimI-like enzyme